MRTRPPYAARRSLCRSRKRRSWSVLCTRKSERSRAASAAISPSRSLRPVSMGCLPFGSSPGGRASRRIIVVLGSVSVVVVGFVVAGSRMVFEVRAHPLAQEHRMVALEDPFAGAMAQGTGGFVAFELVQGRVVRQVEQDHVVEIPAVRDVVPADEPDPEARLVVLDGARKDRPHEE